MVLEQPADGYRFTLDAVLLAHAIAQRQPVHCLEPCAGVGVVSLAAAALSPGRFSCVEVQPELARLCRTNIRRNQLAERVDVVCDDIRHHVRPQRFDVVAMNPPWFDPDSGRIPPNRQRARGRHLLDGSLNELIAASWRYVSEEGMLVVAFSAARVAHLTTALQQSGCAHLHFTQVHPRAGAAPTTVIARAGRGPIRDCDDRPIIVRDASGQYTAHMERILAGIT